jgi:hypothetical protein
MRRRTAVAVGSVLIAAVSVAARFPASAPASIEHEVIAVYLGTEGTDARSGMTAIVPRMNAALSKQAAATKRQFVSHGVSLEPSVRGGLTHLALLGSFDEVSVGGNWTNSAVIRYLGPTYGGENPKAVIPQVVLLERAVRRDSITMQVGPERELGRYVGIDEISAWVRRGAPLPR